MPQLVKGGKWVFGWVIVGPRRELTIPPEAWNEYGFQIGEDAAFLLGSRTSGGFGLSTPRLLGPAESMFRVRVIARSPISEAGRIVVPAALRIQPGDRLLAVRGSGQALGFLARGPIWDEALKHPNLETYATEP